MSQLELLEVLTRPMTIKEIASAAGIQLQRARDLMVFMRKNGRVTIAGKHGRENIYIAGSI